MGGGEDWAPRWVEGRTGHQGGWREGLGTKVGGGEDWAPRWVEGRTGHQGG